MIEYAVVSVLTFVITYCALRLVYWRQTSIFKGDDNYLYKKLIVAFHVIRLKHHLRTAKSLRSQAKVDYFLFRYFNVLRRSYCSNWVHEIMDWFDHTVNT